MNSERAHNIAHELRYAGYAVTITEAEGINANKREILTITARRKFVHEIVRLINKTDQHVMITIANTSSVKGGFLKDKVGKGKKTEFAEFLEHTHTTENSDNETETEEN